MGKFSPCVVYQENQRVAAGAGNAPWFDDICRRNRRDYLRCLRTVEMICRIYTKKDYRKHTRRVARRSQNNSAIFWTSKLSKKDPAIYKMLKQRKKACPSPMPTEAWNTYLLSHFNATPPPKPSDTLNRNSPWTHGLQMSLWVVVVFHKV